MFKSIRLSKVVIVIGILLVSLIIFAKPNEIQTNNEIQSDVDSVQQQSEKLTTGYAVSVDSKLICVLEEYSYADSLVKELIAKAQRYYKANNNYSILNNIKISKGEFSSDSFFTEAEADKVMGIHAIFGAPTVKTTDGSEITLSLSDTTLLEKTEETEFATKYEYTYGVDKSYEKVISEGKKGEIKQLYKAERIDGKVISQEFVLESVVSEPTDRVVEIGVTPSMQLASAELAYFINPYSKGFVTSPYGYRYLNGLEFHTGIDLAKKNGSCLGDTVVAAADGVVVEAGYSSSMGNYVVIKHEYGFSTAYMHFQKCLVSVGDTVSAGDPIGTIGSTGRSTGPHLHFEIRLEGKHTNPENYLNFK